MSISFPALLIYLLPGFLGLWVFKRSVQEDIDRRGESTQIAIALLLGISAIFLLFAVNFILSPFTFLAEYISPDALLPKTVDEIQLILTGNKKFWVSYISLCILAILSGGFWALISEKGLTLTRIVSRYVCNILKHGEKIPCESAMRSLIDEMSEKGYEPSLVRIYSLGENRDNSIIGWWNGYSESEKEIKLNLLECCDSAIELPKEFDLQTRQCLINYESGIVIELLDIDKKQAEGFEKYVKEQYEQILHRN